MTGPAPFADLTPLIAILKSTLTEEQRRIVAAWLLLPDWLLPVPQLDFRQWGLDLCTGCGGTGGPCREAWAYQRKCCPDCSHG